MNFKILITAIILLVTNANASTFQCNTPQVLELVNKKNKSLC